jgi:hypothetical protein
MLPPFSGSTLKREAACCSETLVSPTIRQGHSLNTDFRLSQWYTINVYSAAEFWHHVIMGSATNVLEVHAGGRALIVYIGFGPTDWSVVA